MSRITLIALLLFTALLSEAQGISLGTTTPHPSAILDVAGTTGGLLIPRMTATQRDVINAPAKGLIVYVTSDSSLYMFDGFWRRLVPANEVWSVKGNSGIDDNNFIGTTNNSPFRVKVNNIVSGIIDSTRYASSWGYKSLAVNADGYLNSAFGHFALSLNTSGDENTAFGGVALWQNTEGFRNTAFGGISQYHTNSGSLNSSFGYESMLGNTTGSGNTGVGAKTLTNNISGDYNTALGVSALWNTTTGEFNTGIGYGAIVSVNGSNSTAIGANSNCNESNKIVLGDLNVTKVETNATFIGKGFKSSITVLEILALTSPIEGTIIYNSTAKKPVYFDGTAWRYFNDFPIQ